MYSTGVQKIPDHFLIIIAMRPLPSGRPMSLAGYTLRVHLILSGVRKTDGGVHDQVQGMGKSAKRKSGGNCAATWNLAPGSYRSTCLTEATKLRDTP